MAFCKTEAIVLKKIDYSETSQIVTFYTRDFGQTQAIAKGSKRKRRGGGAIDLLSHYEIVFIKKTTASLDTLTEWQLVENFQNLRTDLDRLNCAYYVAELTRDMTAEGGGSGEENPEVFSLIVRTLHRIVAKSDPKLAVFVLEIRLLSLLGYRPEVSQCLICGQRTLAGKMYFSAREGGVFCRTCADREPNRSAGGNLPGQATTMILVSAGALATIKSIENLKPIAADRLKVSPAMSNEIRSTLNHYITFLLGRQLKMSKYIS